MNWELPFLVKKQHAFPRACQPVETFSLQRKWLLILHWWIHLCHEWIWSWVWICLMRMKSNFILKNSPNKNFRVNAILTHWLSTFPTSVHNLSWTAGGRGSSRAKAFNMGIQNVTLVLSPVVFKWPLNCLGSECRTHRSLYEWNCKSHSCTYYSWKFCWSILPPPSSGLDLSSAFLLCKLSNNQHPCEWDVWYFLKTHTLNYKSTYEWINLCLRLGGVGGVVL